MISARSDTEVTKDSALSHKQYHAISSFLEAIRSAFHEPKPLVRSIHRDCNGRSIEDS